MKKIIINITLTVLFFLMVSPLLAQPSAPPATPIDGGLTLLLAAGGAYGLKKIYDKRK